MSREQLVAIARRNLAHRRDGTQDQADGVLERAAGAVDHDLDRIVALSAEQQELGHGCTHRSRAEHSADHHATLREQAVGEVVSTDHDRRLILATRSIRIVEPTAPERRTRTDGQAAARSRPSRAIAVRRVSPYSRRVP